MPKELTKKMASRMMWPWGRRQSETVRVLSANRVSVDRWLTTIEKTMPLRTHYEPTGNVATKQEEDKKVTENYDEKREDEDPSIEQCRYPSPINIAPALESFGQALEDIFIRKEPPTKK